jgi:hypothetical protein
MGRIVLSIILTLAIIYVVPFLVYAIFSATTGLKPPEDVSPLRFLVSVFVTKAGTAIGFVLIFYFTRDSLSGQWLLYAFIWWLMFIIGEVGQAIGPNYSWTAAVAGIISETIYWPLAAFAVAWLVELK